jgi:hypothetical protein
VQLGLWYIYQDDLARKIPHGSRKPWLEDRRWLPQRTQWMTMEAYIPALLFGGLTITALAWTWLIVLAFQQRFSWGLFSVVLPPIALLFAVRHAQKAIGPLALVILGGLITAVPVSYSLVAPVDPGLREKLREGRKLFSSAGKAMQSDDAHIWMDDRAFYLQAGGVAGAIAAWIWLILRAFRQDQRWGLGSLVLPPVGLVFAARHPRRGVVPIVLLLASLLAAATPALYTQYVPLNLGPRDTLVDGQRHLTLTGWDRKDYSLLKLASDVVVLQMANPDVTDQSLEPLKEMKALEELDLSGTQVTDAGLMILKELPALARLRLARTKITDRGFQDTLLAKVSLMQLDLRATQVSHETVRAWRDAKPKRRVLQ